MQRLTQQTRLAVYDSSDINHLTTADIKAKLAAPVIDDSKIKEIVTEHAYLWVARLPNAAPIFLYGTIHVYIDAFRLFTGAIDTTIEKVDTIYTEIELLTNVIYCLDAFIARQALEQNKQLKPLENEIVRRESGAFKDHGTDENATHENLDKAKETFLAYRYLTDNFRQAEPTRSNKIRNLFWMEHLLTNSIKRKKSSLAACGGLHHVGLFGLPNLLANFGYSVTPLMKAPPPPQSKILRHLMNQERTLFAIPPLLHKLVENLLVETKNDSPVLLLCN